MVKKLSFNNFQKARSYLMNQGREIEQELFRFHFENGSALPVLSALKRYQGGDGGFRNMGEGDPVSSNAMDTSMAFQYISEVEGTIRNEIVQKGINYIIDSFDPKIKGWHPRPNNSSNQWFDNPNAELVGYLYEYRELVPIEFLKDVTENALTFMSNIRNSIEPQFYFLSALCIFRLAVRIDEPNKTNILKQLEDDIFQIIEMNCDKWATTYCAKPFFFAYSPESPLFSPIKQYVVKSLENEINTQSEDGNFILNWNADKEAARIWKSIWTMDVLKALHHHDMIEKN